MKSAGQTWNQHGRLRKQGHKVSGRWWKALLTPMAQLWVLHRGNVSSRVWGRGWIRVKWEHEMQ